MIGDDAPRVMVVTSCTCDVGEHCHPRTTGRKEQTVGSALGSYENRVFVSCAVSLHNCPGFVQGILAFVRVSGVSVATGLLVALDRSVLYTSSYVSPYDGGIAKVHALLVQFLLWIVRFLTRLDSSARISIKKRK